MIQGSLIWLSNHYNAVNTVNIVGFSSAIGGIFLIHGKTFPYRWFLTFCLAVPLFYYHITVGFIDLFASSMVLLAFAGLHGVATHKRPAISATILTIGCTCAMFSKMTVWPAACITAFFGIFALAKAYKARSLPGLAAVFFGMALIAGTSFYPLRNQLLFGNPTHPLELNVYMKTLPAVAVITEVEELNIPSSLVTKSQAMSFVYSLLEMNRGHSVTPFEWSAFRNHGRFFERDQMGGFFFLTVIVLFSTLFMIYLTVPTNELGIGAFATCLIITANLPHSSVLRYFLYIPLIAIFLICIHLHAARPPLKRLIVGGLLLCAAFVIPNLGNTFWIIDPRPHDAFAPAAARTFWQENENQTFDGYLTIRGAYPSTIYWAGPNFNRWKVQEELDNRYINTLRPADQ